MAGVNAAGEATGTSLPSLSADLRAFRFRRGTMEDLGTLGDFDRSGGAAINDAGQVVGSATYGPPFLIGHAFLYSNGHMQDLGTLGGPDSAAYAIDLRGDVTGSSWLPGSNPQFGPIVAHAFLYRHGQMVDIGTFGGTNSTGYGINSRGVIVGASELLGDALSHAFIYIDGSMKDLGALGPGQKSAAYAVNCAGQVTGYSATPDSAALHAFFYTHGHMKDLGTLLPGDNFSVGWGVNSEGEVVGGSGHHPSLDVGRNTRVNSSTTDHAFIYVDGKMFDLMTLIESSDPLLPRGLYQATGINDSGVIAVNGVDSLGLFHGYLLEPLYRHHENQGFGRDRSHGHECSGDEAEEHGDKNKNQEHRDE